MPDSPNSIVNSNAWNGPVSAVVQPEKTQDSDLSGQQLQAPQTQAPQQPLQLEPGVPPITASSPNRNTHTFIARATSALFDAIVGKPGPNYSVDPATGKMIAQAAPPQSAGDKIKRLLNTVGEGLAAGSQVQPRKSGLATALAGAGAGFGAESERLSDADKAGQEKAKGDFEREQQSILHRAQVGQNLALTARNWAEAQKLGAEMDPQRQAGMALYKAAQDAGIEGAELIPFSEWTSRLQKNPKMQTEFHHFPAGFGAPEVDEATGTVKPGPGLIAVMPAHGDAADGIISLPQSYVDQIGKYAALSGRFSKTDVEKIQAGHEVSLKQLAAIDGAVESGRNEWLRGELTPSLNWRNDAKGQPNIPVLSNSVTQEPVGYLKPDVTPGVAVEAVEKRKGEEAKISLETEQAKEARAKAQEALANAELAARSAGLGNGNIPTGDALNKLMAAYNNLPPDAKGFLQNVSPEMQSTILSVWAGRRDPKSLPTSPRPKTGQLSRDQIESIIGRFDPTWRENKYETVAKLEEEYSDPKRVGGYVSSFNQFIRHADQAAQTVKAFQTTNSPIANKSINWLRKNLAGDPTVAKLITDLTAPRTEWETLIHSGHVPTKEETDIALKLADENQAPGASLAVLDSMAHQGVARLDELNERYKTVSGANYPNLISPAARDAAVRLGLKNEISQFGSGGSVFTGSSPLAGSQTEQPKLPKAPAGQVAVQIPGSPVGFIPRAGLAQFQKDHPNAVVGE